MLREHALEIRVAYHETDGQRRVHHANYLNYFERGRVEMLRASGASYRAFEEAGRMLVVRDMTIRYHRPAAFDDRLTLTTTVLAARGARIRHRYVLRREDELVVEAETTIACIDARGRAVRLPPDWQFA